MIFTLVERIIVDYRQNKRYKNKLNFFEDDFR